MKVKNGYKSSIYAGCSHSPVRNDWCCFFVSSVLVFFIMLRIPSVYKGTYVLNREICSIFFVVLNRRTSKRCFLSLVRPHSSALKSEQISTVRIGESKSFELGHLQGTWDSSFYFSHCALIFMILFLPSSFSAAYLLRYFALCMQPHGE
mgnify:CR=1 FL=1